jgi:ABC-2 type transport system ATP-binding protein
MSNVVINVKKLAKFYGKHKGIEDVSFSVNEGEIFGFIGPNGAGKSTTIRTLLALIHPTSGTSTIFGKDCISNASEIAVDIGYLSGEPSYYDNMKAGEFLNYAAELYGKKNDNKIQNLSKRLNLDLNRKIEDLSLGNKKKVGIIAALLHSPKLIILDEPTSGLDPLIQQTFFDILKEENRNGATILFSSHVLSEVQKICHRVAIIKEGRIIDVQNISELRRNGYKKVSISTENELEGEMLNFMGVADLKVLEKAASFLFTGEVSNLLERLNNLRVNDLFIEEPTLEEIFMHYYK